MNFNGWVNKDLPKKNMDVYYSQIMTSSSNFEAVNNTIMLIKTLCQTYQKDKVFANSVLKLMNELRDEINHPKYLQTQNDSGSNVANLLGKIQELEKKKKYYKAMAKQMKSEIQDMKKQSQVMKDMQALLKEKDTFISTLRKRCELLERDLNQMQYKNEEFQEKFTFVRNPSITSNNEFQDLVKECDRYIYDQSSTVSEQQETMIKEMLTDTIEKIKSCQEAYEVFKNNFANENDFHYKNFTQILRLIQGLVQQISLKQSKIKIREKTEKQDTQQTVSMDSLREMKEKLLKEITEQLDTKVSLKVQQTLEMSSNISDNTNHNFNRSQQPIVSKEDIQREILQILQEQNSINFQTQSSDNTEHLNSHLRNKSNGQYHRNCCNSASTKITSNSNSRAKLLQQQQTSPEKKPSIRAKNPNNSIKSTSINHHTENTCINHSHNSSALQRNKKSGSFIMGCDGDAIPFKNNEEIKENLDEKLNKAEERLVETQRLTMKSDRSKISMKSKENTIKSNQQAPFKTINDQLIEMANNPLGEIDDELLLSDQDLLKDQRPPSNSVRETFTFGTKNNNYNQQVNQKFKRTNELSAQKRNTLKEISTVTSMDDAETPHTEDMAQPKKTITPKDEQSKEFNRFGFRNRVASQNKKKV